LLTTLNQGQLEMSPRLRLNPLELAFDRGANLQHAKLTPALCDELLSYITPALSRSTVNGEVSMTVDPASRVPLMATEKMEGGGRVTLHSVQIQGGPLIRVLATLTRNKSAVALQKEAVVNFRVTHGRVYHDKLELYFPDMMIRTSGSVGFDGTLDLIADMTFPPQWLPNVPWKDALAKQPIRIPIHGTLSQPAINEQEFQRLLGDMVRNTAKDAGGGTIRKELEKDIDKALQNLFPKK
jgi:hypothetical protein